MSEDSAVIKNILSRRSIRSFDGKPVPNEQIDKILECACAAPSAMNFRPWHFVIVTDKKKLNALSDVHPYGKMLSQASFGVVVCGEPKRGDSVSLWWEQDCGASMQNILLAALDFGLGSVWLGVNRNTQFGIAEKVRELLGIPNNIEVMGIAAVGYPKEEKPAHSGTDEGAIHKEKW
ncbi:nitroreductase [Synergistales bacterium]|nr:nitroreductase [Synergistales bacterium]